MSSEKAYKLHVEHHQWLESLRFFEDELKYLNLKLSELVSKNNTLEVRKEIEQFQNQFIIQKNEIDELKHYIGEHETYIENKFKSDKSEQVEFHDHAKARERMEAFEHLFMEMKDRFNAFLAKAL